MISVEAQKYWGDFWILIREWDGYEQPNRTRVFKITEEEVDFAGGRFERFSRIQLTQKLVIDIKKEQKLEEIIDWISENTTNAWCFDISTSSEDCFYDGEFYDMVWVFYFRNDEDALGFKLRWK